MSDAPADKPRRGGFLPGVSGNPGGRPKGLQRSAREALALREYVAKDGQTYTGPAAANQCLLDIAFDVDENTRERLRAFEVVFDRGYGKPVQAVELSEAPTREIDMSALSEAQLDALATLPLLEPSDDDTTTH